MKRSSPDADVLRPVTPLGIISDRLVRAAADATNDLATEIGAISELAARLDPYLDACTTPASGSLASLARRTQNQEWTDFGSSTAAHTLEAEMLSGHVEGQALRFFVQMGRAKRVLEIGMFTGYSALAMAEALPHDGRLVACEIDDDVAAFARNCFDDSPDGTKIDIRVGPAIDTLRELSIDPQPFDLVFIDADKAGYCDYLDAVLDGGLLAPGGTICVDNTLMQGQAYLDVDRSENGAAIAAFNDKVVADERIEQVLLPIRDGLTLIRRVDSNTDSNTDAGK